MIDIVQPPLGSEAWFSELREKAARKKAEALAAYRAAGGDWRSTVGAFKNDADYDSAMKKGHEWREQANQDNLNEDS